MMDLATQLALEQEKNRRLQAEVDRLRKAVVTASLEAEKEEEFIVNSFIRRMEQKQKAMAAKASKTQPALHVQLLVPPPRDSYYEAEMKRLRDDKVALGVRFEQEQESMLNRLMRQFKATTPPAKHSVGRSRSAVAAVVC